MIWQAAFPWVFPWVLSALLSVSFCAEAVKPEYDLSDPAICSVEKYVVDLFHGLKSQTVVSFDGSRVLAPLGTRGTFKCNMEIRVPHGYELGIVVDVMNLRRTSDGCQDSIAFLEDSALIPDKLRDAFVSGSGKICGRLEPDGALHLSVAPPPPGPDGTSSALLGFHQVASTRMDVKLRLDAGTPEWTESRVRFVVTAALVAASCPPQFFSCGPRHCISKVLVCNGVPNCGFDGSRVGVDEVNCTSSGGPKTRPGPGNGGGGGVVWAGVVMAILVCSAVVSLLCYWKTRRSLLRTRVDARVHHILTSCSAPGGVGGDDVGNGSSVPMTAFIPPSRVRYDVDTERIEYGGEEDEAALAAKNDVPPPSYESLFRNPDPENHPPPPYPEIPDPPPTL